MGVEFDPVARFGTFKKGDLAKEAAKAADDANTWLPEPMRPAPLDADDLEEEGDIDEEADFDADDGEDFEGGSPVPMQSQHNLTGGGIAPKRQRPSLAEPSTLKKPSNPL